MRVPGAVERVILLCDLDAFFAAVEVLDNPHLAGKPVVVGGNPDSRGVVSTCTYEARKYGIRSAMPAREALRRCPHAVFLSPRHDRYRQVSRQVFQIFERHTPAVEAVSIDEAYLDLTGRDGMAVARSIREEVRRETGLAVSIGVSANKFLAKTACELAKPDGLKQIRKDEVLRVLAPLPVERLAGVGPKTAERLRAAGIRTIGDVQQHSRRWLVERFGRRGEEFYLLSQGIDDRPVGDGGPTKSISEETTFPRDRSAQDLQPVLARLAERVAARLRRAGRRASTVTVKVRFPNFVTITRSRTLAAAVDTDAAIIRVAGQIYREQVLSEGNDPILDRRAASHDPMVRLLGVGVSNLVPADAPLQTSLWDQEQTAREEAVSRVVDRLRDRYGRRALRRGTAMETGDDGAAS